MSDRRREGIRDTIATHQPAPHLRVTAHAGDEYQPPLVRVWSGDGTGVWACAAELDGAAAARAADALRAAARSVAVQGEAA